MSTRPRSTIAATTGARARGPRADVAKARWRCPCMRQLKSEVYVGFSHILFESFWILLIHDYLNNLRASQLFFFRQISYLEYRCPTSSPKPNNNL